MGATKKRRSTKHRGNAAGMVETRGRTGARPVGSSSGGGRNAPRTPQPANWNKALLKGLIPLVILGAVLGFSSKGKSVTSIITLLAIAYLIYVPIVYYTDKFMYSRYVKRGGR